MQVIATAGHVDHGKSALVRALTGMEPDRWVQEQRRGMTIDLGYVWMTLPSGERLAFVDVPGHARFVPNMLAGVGQVPAVLFVVAADGGWMPQSAEHLAAIDALGITHGLLAVTRADLADPAPAIAQAREMISHTSLREVPALAVSAVTGRGLAELTDELDRLAARLPRPDARAPVRIWVDRAFSITGAGTVVTGTLQAGTVSRGDELLLAPAMRPVKVRGLQSLGDDVTQIAGVARVAVNLRGIEAREAGRGMALVQPGRWTPTTVLDARIITAAAPEEDGSQPHRLPRLVTLHAGSARVQAKLRLLGPDLGRLTLREPLPLHVGDRVLLRDPGAAEISSGLAGATVLDVAPPSVSRRGAAAAAVAELSSWPDRPTAGDLLRRHKLIRIADLLAMGIDDVPPPVARGWVADPGYLEGARTALASLVRSHAARNPLAAGMPVDAARAALGLPDREFIQPLLAASLVVKAGLITTAAGAEPALGSLPGPLAVPVAQILADLSDNPFRAPEADRLRQLGLDARALAAAARHGALLRLADQIVLAPGADVAAGRVLAGLPQPFTAAQARAALGTTRRTLIPLLEHLDRQHITRRLPDDRRQIR
jgi:selenocysteine-specific elongation factor